MVLDDRRLYEDVRKFMADFMPRFRDRVHLYKGAEPIFDTYGVESQIKRSLGRKVWLKSGGYLVIDQSEALMAIDVNSGKFVGTHSLEETTLQTNLEAVHEVVYQLRLRNIGGLIVIDFIDMDREVNRETVYRTLEEALKKDRSRTNALKISELGLVEMTRKRVQEGLDRYLTEPCPICAGVGTVRSRPTLSFEILREIRRVHARSPDAPAIIVNTTPDLADLMYGNQYDDLLALEAAIGRKIVVRAQPQFHPEQFEIYARP
jgi:ribonuclease G